MSAGERHRGVEYCRSGGQALCFDAFVPEGAGPWPAAVVVHGGGWVAGDRVRNVEPLFPVLAGAGFAWFSISYTLAANPLEFGAAVDDVRRAVEYVGANAARYRVDARRVVLVGESAGGQLAAMAALREPRPPVAAVVAFYSPMDLESLARSPALGEWGRAAAMFLPRLRELSPLRHVGPGMPPFLLIHGRDDRVVPFEQSESMCRAVRAAGGVCDLVAVRGGGHGLRWWEGAGLTGYKRLMTDWLARVKA